MNRSAFRKLFWGFLLVMLDFRIQGIDILPDIIGYYFFYSGMLLLKDQSPHFQQGSNFSVLMMILSVFTFYEAPVNSTGVIDPTPGSGALALGLAIVSIVLSVLTVYHLFRGIQDMAADQRQPGIESEAMTRWTQYLLINLATLLMIGLVFVPFLFVLVVVVLFVVVLAYTVKVMQFMERCGESLADPLDEEMALDSE